jgi:hypothetical protein
MIYVLMAWIINVQTWAILPINGNPYDTLKECKAVHDLIIKHKITKIGKYKFYNNVQCEKREVVK